MTIYIYGCFLPTSHFTMNTENMFPESWCKIQAFDGSNLVCNQNIPFKYFLEIPETVSETSRVCNIFAVMLFACHGEDAHEVPSSKPGKGKGKQLPFPVKVVPLFRRLQEDLRTILFEPKVGVQCLASQPNSQHRAAKFCALPLGNA